MREVGGPTPTDATGAKDLARRGVAGSSGPVVHGQGRGVHGLLVPADARRTADIAKPTTTTATQLPVFRGDASSAEQQSDFAATKAMNATRGDSGTGDEQTNDPPRGKMPEVAEKRPEPTGGGRGPIDRNPPQSPRGAADVPDDPENQRAGDGGGMGRFGFQVPEIEAKENQTNEGVLASSAGAGSSMLKDLNILEGSTQVDEGGGREIEVSGLPVHSEIVFGEIIEDTEQKEGVETPEEILSRVFREKINGEGIQQVVYYEEIPSGILKGRYRTQVDLVALEDQNTRIEAFMSIDYRRFLGDADPNDTISIAIAWLDPERNQMGRIWSMLDTEGNSVGSAVYNGAIDDESKEIWRREGGAGGFPIFGEQVTSEDIAMLASRLSSSLPNSDLTENAMEHYEEMWNAKRVNNPRK